MASDSVVIISTCMGRLPYLTRSLPSWRKTGYRVVVTDWSNTPALDIPGVTFVRVSGERYFNASRARNAAAAAVMEWSDTPEWLWFIDCDVIVDGRPPEWVFSGADRFTRGLGGQMGLFGTVLVPRYAFENAGGYDERMEGWGGEDTVLYRRLRSCGMREFRFPEGFLMHQEHSDEERVVNHRDKDRLATAARNIGLGGV